MSNRQRRRAARSGVASITVHGYQIITQWTDLDHVGCQVCTPVVAARAEDHLANLRTIHAASLPAAGAAGRQSASGTQETPPVDASEVSTPAASSAHDGRAANAQCATSTGVL